jgi:histidinol-phosphatase
MLDPAMALWDAAPLGVIVEEAGGRAFDLRGTAGIEGGNLVTSNAALGDFTVAALKSEV